MVLFAHPAGHSVSPAMHNAALAALAIDARYEALDVPPERLGEAVADLRRPEVAGANVTIPHKRAVMPWLDVLSADARAVGAVNTITVDGGRLVGDNTDGAGFLRGLAELGVAPRGASCVVLGAGGAARAVAHALLRSGARVALHNRGRRRAEALARALAGAGTVTVLAAGELAGAVAAADLLVQATPVGMEGTAPGASPLAPGVLPRAGAVIDLVYRPPETPLLAAARAAGLRTQSGLPMLLHQGALAFERWFGVAPPLDVMRRAALEALASSERGPAPGRTGGR